MIKIRKATENDVIGIFDVYRNSSKIYPYSLTQNYDEVKLNYIKNEVIRKSLDLGLILIAENDDGKIIGSFKSYTSPYIALAHVMSNTTFVTNPDFEGKKAFKILIKTFFETVKNEYPHIKEVDGVPHSSNTVAIKEYLKNGYEIKGKLENKILCSNSKKFEDEIIIVWKNPNFEYEKLLKYHEYCKEYLNKKYEN